MYTEEDRDQLLEQLVAQARADPVIAAAALVGSAARGTVDRWSDIDLALGVTEGSEVVDAADRWARLMAELATVSGTLDLRTGEVLYRVFLLHDSLQVDVSFWPAGTLASNGGQAFRPLFGDAAPAIPTVPSDLDGVAAWGWLYALHARSAIARGRNWQAVQMIDGLRDQAITLCCARHGLETHHGRGVDRLPEAVLTSLADTLPATLDSSALVAAFRAAVRLHSTEVRHLDPALAERLESPLAVLQAAVGGG